MTLKTSVQMWSVLYLLSGTDTSNVIGMELQVTQQWVGICNILTGEESDTSEENIISDSYLCNIIYSFISAFLLISLYLIPLIFALLTE